ncbi:hypothetical protein PMI07_005712 [Rhizobium sp. CF080]|nr:hypothetical protein PMI07_005712 [Rhizobium sp. CF080]
MTDICQDYSYLICLHAAGVLAMLACRTAVFLAVGGEP